MEDELEDKKHLKIIIKLKAAIQADVKKRFGHGRPTIRGVEQVRKYAQELLDRYIEEMMKESDELREKWILGHPLMIYCRISLKSRHYEIDITTKDNPKAM
jgi:hypothetical protein